MNDRLEEACRRFAGRAAGLADATAHDLYEMAGRRASTAPKSRPAVVPEHIAGRGREAGHLLKGLFSLARDVVTEVTGGAGRQLTQGLRAGASVLGAPGIVTVGRVPQGTSVDVPVIVENTTDAMVPDLVFRASALVSPRNTIIPADDVTVSPEVVHVEAGATRVLTVKVRVGPRVATGRYVGSIDSGGAVPVQATLVVDVV